MEEIIYRVIYHDNCRGPKDNMAITQRDRERVVDTLVLFSISCNLFVAEMDYLVV